MKVWFPYKLEESANSLNFLHQGNQKPTMALSSPWHVYNRLWIICFALVFVLSQIKNELQISMSVGPAFEISLNLDL
jgi:hypothetical protein